MGTIVSKYIDSEKGILIDREEWKALNEQYDKDFIKMQLIEEILAGNIRFPYLDLTIRDAIKSFIQLCNYKCNGMQTGETMTRWDYKYQVEGKYLSETLVGNPASNFFQQSARAKAGNKYMGYMSPYETWFSERALKSALKPIWTLKMDKVDLNTFRQAIALRRYWASQFRPTIAKAIYERYNSVDVLDFSSGWGDRLCGFYSCKNTKSYIGIDPNKDVYDNYFKQLDLYKRIVGEKTTTFYNLPAEEVVLEPNIVDTVFTSPPYFCAETYTNDETQSWVRYKEKNDWLKNFMFKALDNVWRALKPGGHLVVNISDTYRRGVVNRICDPMNDYIKLVLGGTLVESFGMKLSKRPNSLAYKGKTGVCVEPIWAWKKN